MEAFDFPAAMQEARNSLEKLLVEYAVEHPEMGYRDLGEKFILSLGAISKIMKRWKTLRQRIKRYKKHLRKVEREFGWVKTQQTAQRVSGNDQRKSLSGSIRSGVPPIPVLAVPPSHYLTSQDVELALSTLDDCLLQGSANDSGEDSYQNLVHWLKGRQGSKRLQDRAKYLLERYERLRGEP